MCYDRLRAILTAGLIVLLLTVCDDLEGPLNGDGEVQPVGATAVLWAKPVWAKTVNDRCPEDYTKLNADFCYQCPAGYAFGSFPDDDFCWDCPSGYSLGTWTDDRGDLHYSCFP